MTLDKDGMSAPKAKLKCLLHYVSNKTVFGPEYGNTHLLRYTKIFDKGGKTIISAKVAISSIHLGKFCPYFVFIIYGNK